jgi:tellurium resistance protein TerD
MGISLSKEQKGTKISLAKVAEEAGIQGGLTKIQVGLGWDCNVFSGGGDFDLDASVFVCGADGKALPGLDGFVFYNNKVVAGIEHTGDNRTGAGEGDDETILVDLTALKPEVQKLAFTVTIDKAAEKKQNFGMVSNSYIRLIDSSTGTELLRYDLGEDYSTETALVVAEIYKNNGEWKFNAVGAGFAGGLAALCGNFGVAID